LFAVCKSTDSSFGYLTIPVHLGKERKRVREGVKMVFVVIQKAFFNGIITRDVGINTPGLL
jgi:hypothetical protein